MNKLISIIHPSRSRPDMARNTAQKWLERAGMRVEYILSVDIDDPYIYDYSGMFTNNIDVSVQVNLNKSAIEAINVAAKKVNGDLIVVVSDDFDCPDKWAVDLLSSLKDKSDFIVKTQDGLQDWIITLPILDKEYYNRFGYVYPPHISHMFADTWMTHVADLTGRKITLPIKFPHFHYSTGKTKKDAVNVKADSTWSDGESKYLEGVRNNFGLDTDDIKGVLMCNDRFKKWLKAKLI